MATNEQLIFDLVLKIDNVSKDIKKMMSVSEREAKQSGTKAGQSFRTAFLAGVGSLAGAFSFNQLVSTVTSSFNAYKSLTLAGIGLNNVIASQNKQAQSLNATLKDGNKTFLQKAQALGYTEDQLYKTSTATNGYTQQIARMEGQLNQQERAFEDSNRAMEDSIDTTEKQSKAIDRQINLLKKQTNEKIKQKRAEMGFDTLDTELKALEIRKNDYEIQKDIAQIAGDKVAYELAKENIDTLGIEISLRKNKLDAIEFETDAIKKQSDIQIESFNDQKEIITAQITFLREELSTRKNQFDIDIEPAKRKLEDLRNLSSQFVGGTVKTLNEDIAGRIGKEIKEGVGTIDEGKVQKKVLELYYKYDKKISRETLSTAFSRVFQKGVKDVDLATEGVDRWVNAAAQAKAPTVSLNDAIINLATAYQTNSASLGNQSGIQENYEKKKEAALELYNKENNAQVTQIENLSNQAQATYLLRAELEMTNDRANGYQVALNSGLLATEELEAEQRRLAQITGEAVAPAFLEATKNLADLVEKVGIFVKENPDLVKDLILLAGLIIGTATAVLGLTSAFNVLYPIVVSLGVTLGVSTAAAFGLIVVAILAVVAIGYLLIKNWDWIKEQAIKIWNGIVGYLKGNLDMLVGLFTGNKDKLQEGFKNMFSGLSQIVDTIFGGLIKTVKESMNKMFDFVRDIRGQLQGKEFMGIKVNLPDIPRFAKGGDFMVPNGYPNDSYLMRVQSGERVIVQTPQQQNNTNYSNNNVVYNNYGSDIPRGNNLSFLSNLA